MTTTEETATANQNYNQLTGLKLFAMTSSMVISIDEFAPFGKAGATSLFYLLLAGLVWFLPVTQAPVKWPPFKVGNTGACSLGSKPLWEKKPGLSPCFTSGSTLRPAWTS